MGTKKIASAEDLTQLRQSVEEEYGGGKARILVCMTGCRALGSRDVVDALRRELARTGLDATVPVVETGCIGLCAKAPAVLVEPWEYFYGGVKPEDAARIVESTVQRGEPVKDLAVEVEGRPAPRVGDIPFYAEQKRQVLANCGRMDPRSIKEAVARGAYATAASVVGVRTPEEVIDEVTRSGLRGRGGAGFPTGVKWGFCRNAPGDEKYLVCNADEGDPGAFMDRALLEGDPHRVLEGMIIAAYAIGASKGFIYVRAEYPIAVEHVGIALKEAYSYGLLGERIFGSDFSFDIEIRMGAGAFVCGEETALIASLEGERGIPRARPPFPAISGYHGKPTNINNVETLANVPLILGGGAEAYASVGSEGSKGTKIFALAGKVENTGLVEVPMGTPLEKIVFQVGGGIPKGRTFKAAQMGGPSGGCVPAQHLDLRIDFDSVKEVGAIMGSGGLIVLDDLTCMVDIARYFMTFVQSESCGKCVPCRVGTKQMLTILERICAGEAELHELDLLDTLAHDVSRSALCGLGATAPNPVLSTLRYFREEYEIHIKEKRCPAGVCKALTTFVVQPDACKACGICVKGCPAGAIEGGKKKVPAMIHEDRCIRCRICYENCPTGAIEIQGARISSAHG